MNFIPRLSSLAIILCTILCFIQPAFSQIPAGLHVRVQPDDLLGIFAQIEEQTDFAFAYDNSEMNISRRFSPTQKVIQLEELLHEISRTFSVEFNTIGRVIYVKKVVTRENETVGEKGEKSRENISISGTVTDAATGDPLIGATVYLKSDASIGTATDVDGKYELSVSEESEALVFSYIGYESKEVLIGGRNKIDVALNTEENRLEEVIVIGYGAVKKRDVTGAVAKVDDEIITNNPQSSVLHTLQGQVAGLDVVSQNFSAGNEAQIRIRGERSILASNDPLIVLDGIPFAGTLNDVNPQEIASVEILKDASATAIYGSRAANGVVLITTNRGDVEDFRVEVNSYYGVTHALNLVDMMDGNEFANLRREAERNRLNLDEFPPDEEAFDPFELDLLQKNQFTNWQEEIYGQGSIHNQQLALSGGNASTSYYFSGNYFAEDYLIENVDFTRYSFRINVDAKVGERFKIGTSTFYANSIRNSGGFGGTDGLDQVYRTDPISITQDSTGAPAFMVSEDPLRFNPLFNTDRENYVNEQKETRIFPTLYTQYDILDGLFFRMNVGGDIRFGTTNRFRGVFSTPIRGEINDVRVTTRERLGYTFENILQFDKNFNEHKLGATLLFSMQEQQTIRSQMEARDLPLAPSITFFGIDDAVQIPMVENEKTRSQLMSGMARLNYGWKGKYLLTLTGRADGSSVLAEGNKWAFFPSVAVAWRIIEEDFLKSQNLFTDLKLRVSYGLTGNQAIDPYDSQSGLESTNYVFGDADGSGFEIGSLANKDLRWEKTRQLDIGLDFGFWKNRISGSLDYYHATTVDLLYQRRIPLVTGFNSITSNIGSTRNTGVELAVNAVAIDRSALQWTWNATLSFNQNKILDLFGDAETNDVGNNLFIGEPIKVFYDNQFQGIWQSDEADQAALLGYQPGDIKMTDFNGDNRVDDEDRIVLGGQSPKWTAGLSSTLSFSGVELFVQAYTRQDYLVQNEFKERYNTLVSRDGNVAINYWTPENQSNEAPRPNRDDEPDDLRVLSYEDGSFVRVKNITLAYSLPQNASKKFGMERMRIYLTALNPFLFTSFEGIDPEQTTFGGGTKYAQAANTRQFIFGVNLTF